MKSLVEIETVDELQNSWRDPYLQWYAAGMPSFNQQAKDPWKQIILQFRTHDDRVHFGETLNYKLTDRTQVIWYPSKDRDPNMRSRYVEDGMKQDIIEYKEV